MTTALVIIGLIVVAYIVMYNSLVAKKNQIDNAQGAISAYLKKRADLIPNLVATVQQYTKHEADVLVELTRLRSQTDAAAKDINKMVENDASISGMLRQVALVVENYPDLKANENYMSLQAELTDIEDQLSAARRTYNANVVRYNDAVEQIPTNIIAGIMNYREKPVFKVTAEEAKNPVVADLFNKAA